MFSFLIVTGKSSIIGGQTPEWMSYTKGEKVTSLAEDGEDIWLGTSRGLVKVDKETGISTSYLTADSAFPLHSISCLAVDGSGNKWFGTGTMQTGYFYGPYFEGEGLVKYDGTDWVRYTMSDFPLPSDYITCIAPGANGGIWIGTDRGLAKLEDIAGTQSDSLHVILPSVRVHCIAFDGDGRTWIGTSSGLVKIEDSTYTLFDSYNSGLMEDDVRYLAVDSNGGVWTGATKHLEKFDEKACTVYSISPSGLSNISCISIDKNGDKWIASSEGGLAKFDGTDWTTFDPPVSALWSRDVSCFIIDGEDRKWIGTGNGVLKFDGSSWSSIIRMEPLPSNLVSSIAIGENGEVWIGTDDGGLASFDGINWSIYNTSNSHLPSDRIFCVTIDRDGSKLIGTPAGLTRLVDTTWTDLNTSLSYGAYCLVMDDNGDYWTLQLHSLYRYDSSGQTIYNLPDLGPYDPPASCLAIGDNGKKWIGTHGGGLVEFDGNSWSVHSLPAAPPLDSMFCLAADKEGRVWTGTCSGLGMFDGADWTFYKTGNSGIPSNLVSCLSVDEYGNKWVGTVDAGLAKFDGTNWLVFDMSNSGLPSNSILSIALDGSGNKWIGTRGGLAVFKEGGIVQINERGEQVVALPEKVSLRQNYPNPFNPRTTISYEVSANCFVSLRIYDLLGREVRTLVNERKNPGTYEVVFDASSLPSGVYFYRLTTGGFVSAKKMLILK